MYNTPMQNTYLYIRFSHDKQAEGSSYDRQLGKAREFCSSLIEDKAHVFFDSGKSAFHGEQLEAGGELRRFYDAVKSGEVPKGSTLLVEDLDRLSRAGMWTASDKLRELTENGIAVRTLRDGKLYTCVFRRT
jgi:DNA invertase Pin-like site-specific DNA recombinase